MAFGEHFLAAPQWGWWTLSDLPEAVNLEGRLFRKAKWQQPYDGVVEQYREAVERNSAHMKVLADGRWVIDHIDDDNPDMGRVLEHGLNDTGPGKFLKAAAPVVGVMVLITAGIAGLVTVVQAFTKKGRR